MLNLDRMLIEIPGDCCLVAAGVVIVVALM